MALKEEGTCARGRDIMDKIRQANNGQNVFSPALQMITAEVMANQGKTKSLGAGGASNAYRRWDDGRGDYHYDVNGATSRRGDADATGTTLHEFTHVAVSEAYDNTTAAFSLPLNASTDDILKIRDKRVKQMENIQATIPTSMSSEHGLDLGTTSYEKYVTERADYGAHGSKVRDTYVDQELGKLKEELRKAYESNNEAQQNKIRADVDQFKKVVDALNSVPGVNADSALVEYDSVINQMLIAYEMITDDRSSEHYRKIKAAALRAHVDRHNAKLKRDNAQ